MSQGGLPNSSQTRDFAESLYARIPRSSGQNGGAASYTQQERAKAALAAKNRKYALLEASDEEDEAPIAPPPSTSAVPREVKKKTSSEDKGRVWPWVPQACVESLTKPFFQNVREQVRELR